MFGEQDTWKGTKNWPGCCLDAPAKCYSWLVSVAEPHHEDDGELLDIIY